MWKTAIVSLLLAMPLSGCGSDDVGAPPTGPGPLSLIPTSYRMDLHASCGERQLIGDFDVTVRDGRVVEAGPPRLVRRLGLHLRDFPTLTDLVEKAEQAEGDATVDLRVDRSGVPRSLSIDHDPQAIDDEECYRITRVRRLSR